MLLETIKNPVTTSGVITQARATITASAKVFNFFSTQTYSDNYVAICRELVANAIDAHTAIGNPDPVKVQLPTILVPEFSVTDEGIGMSHAFMMDGFLAYTTSTKQNSNEQIGGFGIGSKSPFAYCDQYTIQTTHNQVTSTYSVFRDEEGIPAIACLDQSPAAPDTPSGTRVSFPVKDGDIDRFEQAAQKSLKYFDPLPIVTPNPVTPQAHSQKGKGWAVRAVKDSSDPNIIMGGVAYPVQSYKLYDLPENLKPLMGMSLDLYVPIGTFDIALSREELSYNDDITPRLTAILNGIYDDVVSTIPTMFDHLPSRWEATMALKSLYKNHSKYSGYGKLVADNIRYKGEPLSESLIANKDCQWDYVSARTSHRRRGGYTKCPIPKWETALGGLPLETNTIIIVDDLPLSPASRTTTRIRNYVDEKLAKDVPVLLVRNTTLDDLGNPPSDVVVYTSQLELPPVIRSPRTGQARPHVRMWNPHAYYARQANSMRPITYQSPVEEIPYADQPSEGVLVVMDNFELPDNFWPKFDAVSLGYPQIYLVNSGDAVKLKNSGFTMFDDYFNEKLEEFQTENPNYAKHASLATSELRHLFQLFKRHPDLNPKPRSPLGKIKKLMPADFKPSNFGMFIPPYTPSKSAPDTTQLLADFETQQPKAAAIIESLGHNLDDVRKSILKDYI